MATHYYCSWVDLLTSLYCVERVVFLKPMFMWNVVCA